jgi:hypothetical protein
MTTSRPFTAAGVSLVFVLALAACSDANTDDPATMPDTNGSTDTTTSDTSVADTAADTTADPDTTGTDPDTRADTGSGCSNDTQIGWTAELSTNAHDVDGTAVIRDSDTIAIDNFTFDGEGPAVFVYVASCDASDNGQWGEGVQVGDQLDQAYSGETVTFPIPDAMAVSEIGGLSIWCVDFSVDFGSGLFTAP